MTDLTPMTALGLQTARVQTHGALTLTEAPDLALASISLRNNAVQPDLKGLALPPVGRLSENGELAAFWMGPDQWMIEARGLGDTGVAHTLKDAAPGCSVTEQTDGFVAIEVQSNAGGARIRALMGSLVNFDAITFDAGSAARTGLEHMVVFVIRRAEDRLALIGMRSQARSLWHAVEQASKRLPEINL